MGVAEGCRKWGQAKCFIRFAAQARTDVTRKCA